MRLKSLELTGFKSFAKKTEFLFESPVTAIVGPNGSGKSNCAEAFRWVLGERSLKSLRSGRGEDLIFNGGTGASKPNRAAVTLVFDNHDRKFNLDFDEVTITREVYRDGENVYVINGSAVRYRDIVELLAAVSLGSSEHYIVNQGDADRALAANPRERRAMVEDALGLRLYQWKIEESEKKLEKTADNQKQVESLRRELAPHLKFLKKQVEKLEQANRLRAELKAAYFEYLAREEEYLHQEERLIKTAREAPAAELEHVEHALARALAERSAPAESATAARIAALDRELARLGSEKDELSRRLGRLEGMVEIKALAQRERASQAERDFSYREVVTLVGEVEAALAEGERFADPFSLKSLLGRVRQLVRRFLERGATSPELARDDEALAALQREQEGVQQSLAAITARTEECRHEREALQAALAYEASAAREAEREVYELRATKSELHGRLAALAAREDKWRLEFADFKRELEEGVVLVDQEIKRFRELGPRELTSEPRERQEERRRQLERLKIRLEDMGLESTDTLKEYEEATERDQFLAKELADLEASAASLRQIIDELRRKIDDEFKTGVTKINRQFQEFFSLMFGGGDASLELVREKPRRATDLDLGEEALVSAVSAEESEGIKEGIEIRVNLPRKKVKSLEMLSGGERALTSIALLFAMSQVNPPPFLILDETDAALDEANSRKYGEMVATLAKHSQLILITHNRETMSRAGVIYGITMGSDGISKQLSIKFDDATVYAK